MATDSASYETTTVQQLCPNKYKAILQLWLHRFKIIESDGLTVTLDRMNQNKFKTVVQNAANFIKKKDKPKQPKKKAKSGNSEKQVENSSGGTEGEV